jgi:hypothetical protein
LYSTSRCLASRLSASVFQRRVKGIPRFNFTEYVAFGGVATIGSASVCHNRYTWRPGASTGFVCVLESASRQ